ncbi:MAG: prepilin-type N-terminal cleavage/methylation domain-containing protein [Candidatus Omnitrophica bacterium]|nr:prepilin-type N-terminal cleavage/methylation domain-containing protein [Candidatus Omnitrophota bacterium]
MKSLLNKNGLTLTELLVASIMIAIVMVGVASFGSSITGMQASSGRAGLVGLSTVSALAQLRADIESAVGDSSSMGVVSGKSEANGQLCLRQEGGSPATPDDYTDDTWVCYTHVNSYDIFRCDGLASAVTDCTSTGSSTFFFSFPAPSPTDASFFDVDMTGGAFQFVEVTLKTRTDPTVSADPMKNPEKEMITRISPISHSRQ